MSTPRFLADQNLRHAIVRATLRAEPTIEFATALELGLAAAPDPEILEFAHVNHWIVVTHDVNTMRAFAEERLRNGQGIGGLFLAPDHHPAGHIADSLLVVWGASQAEEWQDQIQFLPL